MTKGRQTRPSSGKAFAKLLKVSATLRVTAIAIELNRLALALT